MTAVCMVCCPEEVSVALLSCECVWKNSTWLGTSMMINREIPLAEIVG